MQINPYLALAVNGFCTGIGVVFASHFYQLYLKEKFNRVTKKLRKIKKKIIR